MTDLIRNGWVSFSVSVSFISKQYASVRFPWMDLARQSNNLKVILCSRANFRILLYLGMLNPNRKPVAGCGNDGRRPGEKNRSEVAETVGVGCSV
jgi:hypothetical protein